MSNLHLKEQRFYRVFWVLIPLSLAISAYFMPVLHPPPVIKIKFSDQNNDHLFTTHEEINFGFDSDDLDREHLRATWTFGGSVLIKGYAAPDSGKKRIKAKLDWGAGEENDLGISLGIKYDSLDPEPVIAWNETFTAVDTSVLVKFPQAGRYRLRLQLLDTLDQVEYQREREIEIISAVVPSPLDTVVRIIGPHKGLVGEELLFSSTGSKVNFWYWKFGDGKNQDDDREQVVYTYHKEGKYEVRLKTDYPDAWHSHWVEISPTWNADSLPVEEIDSTFYEIEQLELDLRRRLQAIANTPASQPEGFYKNKDFIERNYLSEPHKPIDVWVNEEEEAIDFESYCQRIHFLEGELVIDEVTFEWAGDGSSHRIRSLNITQRKMSN